MRATRRRANERESWHREKERDHEMHDTATSNARQTKNPIRFSNQDQSEAAKKKDNRKLKRIIEKRSKQNEVLTCEFVMNA